MNNIMLKRDMSKDNAYVLLDPKQLKKGDKIPIVSDTMFNAMINNESKKQYASYLIALVLNMDYNKVYNSIIFVKENLDKDRYIDSKKTVDFVCEIDEEIIGIEMNNNKSRSSLERNISYAADLYKSKMIRGKKYDYRKVYQINLNNFTFEGNDKIIERYSLKNEEGEIFTDKLNFIHIYLPNIAKKDYTNITELEKMLLVYNNEITSSIKLAKGDDILEKFIKDAVEASNDDEIIGLYDKELHLEKLKLSEIEEAKEDARYEGLEEGRKEGKIEGRKEGKIEGIREGKIEILKNMLNKRKSIIEIEDNIGLNRKELIEMVKDNKELSILLQSAIDSTQDEITGSHDKELHLEKLKLSEYN